jgi:ABC-type multidrug transport system ATPase subunit
MSSDDHPNNDSKPSASASGGDDDGDEDTTATPNIPKKKGIRHVSEVSFSSSAGSDVDSDHDQTPKPRQRPRIIANLLYKGDNSNKPTITPRQNRLGQSRLVHMYSKRKARQRYLKTILDRKKASTDANNGGHDEERGGDDEEQKNEDEVITPPLKPPSVGSSSTRYTSYDSRTSSEGLTDEEKDELKKSSQGLLLLQEVAKEYGELMFEFPIEVRMSKFTYSVPITEATTKIKTVYNSSFVYHAVRLFKRLRYGSAADDESHEKVQYKQILDNISLSLKPGKMYLVMGPPGSGKSSLLKAIAGRLREEKKYKRSGSVTYNGVSFDDDRDVYIENAIAMIDQLDIHAPRYTVEETFSFAFQCKKPNGHHVDFRYSEDTPENREKCKVADGCNLLVDATIKMLGIDHVRNSFVGNDEIRGVSGGQRRRVTIGEMLQDSAPVLCGDEISNGLDATSTYDIMNILYHSGKIRKKLQVISLLQPSPETMALFCEVILLGEGKIIYSGPIHQVENYFASLGYVAPVHMDVADFLQLIATPDGAKLFDPPPEIATIRSTPYTLDELAVEFANSRFGQIIESDINQAHRQVWGSSHGDVNKLDSVEYLDDRRYKNKYANSFSRSMWLNLRRQLTLWKRDKRVLFANAAKNMIMGISVGGVFFQTDDVVSILGVLFQGMLFVMLGGMVTAPAFVDERLIYYKQADANFFGSFSFIIAKAMSKLPQVSTPVLGISSPYPVTTVRNLTFHNIFLFLLI